MTQFIYSGCLVLEVHLKFERFLWLPCLFDLPHATLASGSCLRCASNTASLIWSQILSVEQNMHNSLMRFLSLVCKMMITADILLHN